jgi:hypothetical protein
MNYLVIEGLAPWDGRYEFDLAEQDLTTREWGWIKRLSGYLPATFGDGLGGIDPELICVFAAIALRRAGRIQTDEVVDTYNRFVDQPFKDSIFLEADDEPVKEDDASPPTTSSNGSSSISGPDSRTSSERSDLIPPASGIPASATSTSAPRSSVR